MIKIKAIIQTLINETLDNPLPEDYKIVEQSFTAKQYRQIYTYVGEKYCWWMKQVSTDDDLEKHLSQEYVYTYFIKYKDEVIGFTELHTYQNNIVYIQYFALFDEFIGQGHGKNSLNYILNYCKNNFKSKKLFTTTNNLDHENAIIVYKKCGFTEFSKHEEIWEIPNDKVNITITERNKIWLLPQ